MALRENIKATALLLPLMGMAGCETTPLIQEPVVTISRCHDLQRDLAKPLTTETQYWCGGAGHGALVHRSPYLGSDGKLHKNPTHDSVRGY